MVSWLIAAAVLPSSQEPGYVLLNPPTGTPAEEVSYVVETLCTLLKLRSFCWSHDTVRDLVQWLLQIGESAHVNAYALAAAFAAHPRLLYEIPGLAAADHYADARGSILLMLFGEREARSKEGLSEFRRSLNLSANPEAPEHCDVIDYPTSELLAMVYDLVREYNKEPPNRTYASSEHIAIEARISERETRTVARILRDEWRR